jgi:hypothetical protein
MQGIMMRRVAAFLALFAMGPVDAHAATGAYPSLARRPVESRDRDASKPAVRPAATDAALASQVETLGAQATTADTAFKTQIDKSRSTLAAAAGTAPMSEAWVAAQMAISTTDAARYDSVAALASLDTLYVDRQDNADASRVAADIATIDPVRVHVLAIVDAQNDTLDGLRASLKTP